MARKKKSSKVPRLGGELAREKNAHGVPRMAAGKRGGKKGRKAKGRM